MDFVIFLMNKWFEIEKYCKCLSCITPCYLGKHDGLFDEIESSQSEYINISQQKKMPLLPYRLPLVKLLVVLERNIHILINDYYEFISQAFVTDCVNHPDSLLAICAKYQFYKTFCVTYRLVKALAEVLQSRDLMDVRVSLNYFTQTLMPTDKLYHDTQNKPLVLANKINEVYRIAFAEHLNSLCYPYKTSSMPQMYNSGITVNELDPYYRKLIDIKEMDILSYNKELNSLLKWSSEISSYPIIPPNLMGLLLSTRDKRTGRCGLLQPGLDNLLYKTGIDNPTVCLHCKLLNLCVGHTDDIEQREKLKCYCLYKQNSVSCKESDIYKEDNTFLDNLTIINSQMCLHLLFLSKEEHVLQGYGCQCNDHKGLFRNYVKKYYDLITDLQLIQKGTT